MLVHLTPPVPGEEDVLPLEVEVAQPQAVNAAATTTARSANLGVSSNNRVFAVWAQRDDSQAETQTLNPISDFRSSQKSSLLFRRDLELRAAEISGGAIGASWLVDDIPLEGSTYEAAIAPASDGEVAVAWVHSSSGIPLFTALRRFDANGQALENSIEIGAGSAALLIYDQLDRLNLAFLNSSSISKQTFDPPVPEPETENEEAEP